MRGGTAVARLRCQQADRMPGACQELPGVACCHVACASCLCRRTSTIEHEALHSAQHCRLGCRLLVAVVNRLHRLQVGRSRSSRASWRADTLAGRPSGGVVTGAGWGSREHNSSPQSAVHPAHAANSPPAGLRGSTPQGAAPPPPPPPAPAAPAARRRRRPAAAARPWWGSPRPRCRRRG